MELDSRWVRELEGGDRWAHGSRVPPLRAKVIEEVDFCSTHSMYIVVYIYTRTILNP
jgi:hypothetical protein